MLHLPPFFLRTLTHLLRRRRGSPLWVKVFIVLLSLLLILVIVCTP